MACLKVVDVVGLDPDHNLLIECDQLQAFKAIGEQTIYAERLLGQIKVAYLDPPFNNGQHVQHYRDKIDPLSWNIRLKDSLALIRRLLSADGSLWLHLNDTEQHRARLVLDEVFGPEHFVGTVIWEKTRMPRFGKKPFAVRHDYIHVYRKSRAFRLARPAQHPVEAIWPCEDVGSTDTATAESKRLFRDPFATPKPEALLRRIIELTTVPQHIVLDCFAGSGTTPAVAHKLGRRWIAIECEATTVSQFLKPRMQQVVDGADRGGISTAVAWSGGGGFTHLVGETQRGRA